MKGGGKPQPSARLEEALPQQHCPLGMHMQLQLHVITHLHYAWAEFRDGNVYM